MLVGPNNKKLGPAFWMSLGIFPPFFLVILFILFYKSICLQ